MEELWHNHFSNCPPVGWKLRDAFHSQWVRFHALPKSKRYPDTHEETQILLERGNLLASNIFGENENFCLISSSTETILDQEFKLTPLFSWQETPIVDEYVFNARYCHTKWKSGKFDSTLESIANEIEHNIIFLSLKSFEIFAPYDGGYDLILSSSERVKLFKQKFSPWLSALPSGY